MRRAAAFACPLRVGSGVKNKILADEIRRSGSQRCEETAPTGRWKPAIETHGGRASAGHPGAEGDHHKKLKTQAKQTTATLMVARFGLGQRRVCRIVRWIEIRCATNIDEPTTRGSGRGCERSPRPSDDIAAIGSACSCHGKAGG